MKTKFYFGAFAALALGFASCSSDEPINGPVDPDGPTVGESYMAVVIQNIGSNGKAAVPGDDDFEDPAVGSTESSFDAENIRFYFFTAEGQPFIMLNQGVNGTVSHTNMVKPNQIEVSNDDGVGQTIKGILVLGEPEKYLGNKPAKVFCVANPIVHNFEDFANITLNQIKQIDVTYAPDKDPFGKFVMTSSSYASSNATDAEEIFYTDVTDCIKTTAAEAENNPAKIFLERLAAKVRVKGLGTKVVREKGAGTTNPEAEFSITGIEGKVKLDVELAGWELVKNAKKTFAVKNIKDFIANPPFENWNDATHHRSYWAYTACAQTTDFFKSSFNIHEDAFSLGNYDADHPTANIAYCYGNTRFAETVKTATDRTSNATAILVKGIVKKHGDTEPLDLVNWGGQYFLTDNFKQMVADAYNREHNTTLTKDNISFKNHGTNKNTWKVYVEGDGDWDRFDNISWWNKGVTSYYLNIKHFDEKFGVVRNHIYDYTLTDVIGLGVPGSDPENPEELKASYLAAVVYCLNWRIVSNTTVLE